MTGDDVRDQSSDPRPHEEFEALAVGWALHALEPEDEERLDTHLRHCRSCQDVADEAYYTADDLATTVAMVAPPASLRDAVLAITQQPATSPEHPVTSIADAGPDRAARSHGGAHRLRHPAESDSADRSADDAELRDTRKRSGGFGARSRPGGGVPELTRPPGRDARRTWRRSVLAAAAVIAIAGLAVWNVNLRNDRNHAQVTAQRYQAVVSQVVTPGSKLAVLKSSSGQPRGAVVESNGKYRVVSDGMPPDNASKQTYVLWGLTSPAAKPQAVGTFDVSNGTVGVAAVDRVAAGSNPGQYVAYGVSRESGRTAPAAPSHILATGSVRS